MVSSWFLFPEISWTSNTDVLSLGPRPTLARNSDFLCLSGRNTTRSLCSFCKTPRAVVNNLANCDDPY
ncbi:uncharacterized protein ARMOST_12559 [Armillaria ostoyae]|uniref:Uncharacterized protein n=1 Tax=Armillaria ostoyae TaxID=47428 RepID=A0A284RK97_ARMOS|nr:uncharacterized protein ARMOST_12559 [Armillaria ostoyae]